MKYTRFPVLAAAISLLGAGAIHSAKCLDNLDFHQNLPAEIGKEDQTGKFAFALKCDTVFVRQGVTTTVHPGTMLYFARPTLNSVIKVEGTLIIKGSKNSHVSLSGSIDSTRNGLEPGKRPWGGIEVAEGGKLDIAFAGFMRAPTPITSFSFQVKIINTWFNGSSGMILPDGSLFAMDSKWQTINDMDLTKGNFDRLGAKEEDRPPGAISLKEKEALLQSKPFWTWKKAAVGAGALALVGVGATFMLAPEEEPNRTPPGPGPNPDPTKIDLTEDPPPMP